MLDRLYAVSLWAAAFCVALIAALVLAQVAGRLLDGALALLGVDRLGLMVPSLAEFGGYLLAAASFLGLAGALRAGDHIRVTMGLYALGPGARRLAEVFTLGLACVVALVALWQLGAMAVDSWRFGEVSYGIVPIPLWAPQASVAVGLAIFALALADETLEAWRRGKPGFERIGETREQGGGDAGM